MKTGLYISGIGHGLFILWVLIGGIFTAPRPEPLEVAQVSLVSAEEFAALAAPASAPRAVEQPVQPVVPEAENVAPVSSPEPTPDARPTRPAPTEVTEPALETPPDLSDVTAPPVAEVEETPPTQLSPPVEESTSSVIADTAPPRPTPRVAPEAAPAPPIEAVIDTTVAEATVPSEQAETPAPEVEQSTAPEEASTEIVTEAEQDTQAIGLASSSRPRARPERPTPPAPQPPADPAPQSDAIADAVAQAVAGGSSVTSGTGTAPVGPPMTQGERDALRIAVSSCWVVDAGSEAGRITVTLAMSMNEDGTVKSGTLRMISNSGGADGAVESAFQAARRAVLRCQKGGYQLPPEKFAQWRDIEMTFNPERMRIK